MCRLFWVGLIACLLAAFSTISFFVRSAMGAPDIDIDGPLTAEADVYKKRSQTIARGKVWASPSARHGAYAISVVSGGDYDGAAGHYRNGLSTVSRDARDYTSRASNARASAWISGHDRHGDAYFANASKSSGG